MENRNPWKKKNGSDMQVRVNLKNVAMAMVGAFFLYLGYLLFGPGQPKLPEIWVDMGELISYSILAVERGGHAVTMIHKEKHLGIKTKGKTKEGKDEFLTKADMASNQLILETLHRLPVISIISEEKTSLPESEIEMYKLNNYELWMGSQDILKGIPHQKVPLSEVAIWVDPLDATQEYTEDLLQYVTVMICVAVGGRPKFGVIYRPFQRQTVWGLVGHGIYPNASIGSLDPPKRIVISRSHTGTEIEGLIKESFPEFTIEPAGGAGYKTLRVLNSTAALYLHKTAIKKWDVCAGDAIVRAAGGRMVTLKGDDLTYFANDPEIKNTHGLLVSLNKPFSYLAKIKSVLSKQTSSANQSKPS